ncbi:MAG TPA: class I SAM-dependent methyltransferase [Thermoanaerobaculia bacterium]|nr:class I SAM-dependent methyltransferase [Thermoanaerobaculia bacterium]
MEALAIEQSKLESLVERVFSDLVGSHGGFVMQVGHRLGLYKAMAGAGPLTSDEVATRAGCAERYVREWLNSHVAAGYIEYDARTSTYELSPEAAMVLANEESPFFMPHALNLTAAMWAGEERTLEAFRTGKGVSWGEHDPRVHHGVAAFYRNGYQASLVSQWLPALDGVVDRLNAGINVADIGCGYGHSTILMAEAFPKSRFYGFDVHEGSIEEARRNAFAAGVADRVTFEVARATDYAKRDYGLICFFDALHDMGDPVAAVRYAASALAFAGTVMAVEPFAADKLEQNLNPIARLYYAGSTVLCTAHAISEGGELVLGAQAGEARLGDVFRKGGFTRFRRAAETPFNLILEARR